MSACPAIVFDASITAPVVSVKAGKYITCVVFGDQDWNPTSGLCFGKNDFGQCGQETNDLVVASHNAKLLPDPSPEPSVTDIIPSSTVTCAVYSYYVLKCFGEVRSSSASPGGPLLGVPAPAGGSSIGAAPGDVLHLEGIAFGRPDILAPSWLIVQEDEARAFNLTRTPDVYFGAAMFFRLTPMIRAANPDVDLTGQIYNDHVVLAVPAGVPADQYEVRVSYFAQGPYWLTNTQLLSFSVPVVIEAENPDASPNSRIVSLVPATAPNAAWYNENIIFYITGVDAPNAAPSAYSLYKSTKQGVKCCFGPVDPSDPWFRPGGGALLAQADASNDFTAFCIKSWLPGGVDLGKPVRAFVALTLKALSCDAAIRVQRDAYAAQSTPLPKVLTFYPRPTVTLDREWFSMANVAGGQGFVTIPGLDPALAPITRVRLYSLSAAATLGTSFDAKMVGSTGNFTFDLTINQGDPLGGVVVVLFSVDEGLGEIPFNITFYGALSLPRYPAPGIAPAGGPSSIAQALLIGGPVPSAIGSAPYRIRFETTQAVLLLLPRATAASRAPLPSNAVTFRDYYIFVPRAFPSPAWSPGLHPFKVSINGFDWENSTFTVMSFFALLDVQPRVFVASAPVTLTLTGVSLRANGSSSLCRFTDLSSDAKTVVPAAVLGGSVRCTLQANWLAPAASYSRVGVEFAFGPPDFEGRGVIEVLAAALPTLTAARPAMVPAFPDEGAGSNMTTITLSGRGFAPSPNATWWCTSLGGGLSHTPARIDHVGQVAVCSFPPIPAARRAAGVFQVGLAVLAPNATIPDKLLPSTSVPVSSYTVEALTPLAVPRGSAQPVVVLGGPFAPVGGPVACTWFADQVSTASLATTQGAIHSRSSVSCALPQLAFSALFLALGGSSRLRILAYAPAFVTKVTPSSGPLAGGDAITLLGNNFALQGADNVTNTTLGVMCRFGTRAGIPGTLVAAAAGNQILCPAPAFGSSMLLPVEVSLNGGASYSSSPAAASFAALGIEAVTPRTGPVQGGVRVMVRLSLPIPNAALSTPGSVCLFYALVNNATAGLASSSPATLVPPQSVACVMPPWGSAARVAVGVRLPDGLAVVNPSTAVFNYHSSIAVIGAVDPLSGPASGGGRVQVEVTIPGDLLALGEGSIGCVFGSGAFVRSAAVVSGTSPSRVSVSCAPPPGTGSVPVYVTFNGGATLVPAGTFTYVRVLSFSPALGPASGDSDLFVDGDGFLENVSHWCRLAGTVFPCARLSASRLVCRVPALPVPRSSARALLQPMPWEGLGATETGGTRAAGLAPEILVGASPSVTAGVGAAAPAGTVYTFYPPPEVTAISPARGFTAGGAAVTVYGRYMMAGDLSACRFRTAVVRATAGPVSSGTLTSLVCNSTAGAPGRATVAVSNNGQDFSPSNVTFSYEQCPAGSFALLDTDPCTPCPMGYFAGSGGTQACTACGLTEYANATGMASCIACANFTTISTLPSDSRSKCRCSPGAFLPSGSSPGDACAPCPTGASCAGDLAQPVALPGYWCTAANPTVFLACAGGEVACPGGAPDACGEGSGGRLCSECKHGYFKLGFACKKCNRFSKLVLAGFMIFLCLLVILFLKVIGAEAGHGYAGTVSVAMDYFQILGILGNVDFKWPPFLQRFIRYVSSPAFLRPDLLASECSAPSVRWPTKWISVMLLPVFFALAFTAIVLLCVLYNALRGGRKRVEVVRLRDLSMNAFNLVFNLEYMLIVSWVFSFFGCSRLEDGKLTLDADPSMLCSDSWWHRLLPAGVACIVVYVLGQPIFSALLVYRNRKRLRLPAFSRKYSSMYFDYKTHVPYWGTVEKFHKLFIGVVATFLTQYFFFDFDFSFLLLNFVQKKNDRSKRLQSILLMLAMIVMLLLQRGFRPMFDPRDDTLQTTL